MPHSELLDLFLSSTGICTDTRKLQKGQLFVALKGDNFNGNAFASQALKEGARAVIIDEAKYASPQGTYLVNDGLIALQRLAQEYRRTLSCPTLALTGSNGKTTTKELIDAVLSTKYKVHATAGNYNNHIGVPLTILSAPSDTEILILEMGANHLGEIKELCDIALPDYGLITNIGRAHLEGFGSLAGVIEGKTEMYRHIAKSGRLVFYDKSDETLFNQLPSGIKAVSYRKDVVFTRDKLKLGFNLSKKDYLTQLVGSYNQPNIEAALSVSQYFDVEDKLAAQAIADYIPKINRSETETIGDCELILDAYNANPTSMRAAINSFRSHKTTKNKNLILGDMKELGHASVALHREIIDLVSESAWHSITLIGPHFTQASEQSGYSGQTYKTLKACIADFDSIKGAMKKGITLLKASRSLKLESLKDLL